MKSLDEKVVFCCTCGALILVSLVPHYCKSSPLFAGQTLRNAEPTVCEVLDEKHEHIEESQYPAGAGIPAVRLEIAAGTAVFTTSS